jgi:hypothetical protein
MVTLNGDQNIFGFQPWHRRSEHKKVVGLMQLDWNGLLLLCGYVHSVLLHEQPEYSW